MSILEFTLDIKIKFYFCNYFFKKESFDLNKLLNNG